MARDGRVQNDDVVLEPKGAAISSFADLWFAKAGEEAVPARSDFPMEALRPWIGNLILMDVLEGGEDFRYRLIGTDIVSVIGRDLTGRRVSESDYDGGRDPVLASFRLPVETRKPVFRQGKVNWRFKRSYLDYESVHCPLRATDDEIAMTIGVQIFTDPFAT